ncbi:MAG: penicillin acylase family protein, partial [Pseudomonadota bacterium]
MRKFLIWSIRIVTTLFIVGLGLGYLAYYVATRSLPDYDNTVQTPDAPGAVDIIRNPNNVPHIFGPNNASVLYGLGYAHAQDRLWQMMLMRRTAQGRLSELFGPETLPIDSVLRRLDINRLSQTSVDAMRPDTRALLQAYADGVNARLTEVNTNALGRGAPEFFLFSNALSPWQPADSVALMKIMALQLSAHLEHEVRRARASMILDPNRLQDLMPAPPGDGQVTLPPYQALLPGVQPQYASGGAPHALSPFKPWALAGASNAWAANATRSAAGGTLLANDPHLGLTAPSIWYLARVDFETGGVIGGTIPGIPTVLVGRSNDLGWGLTYAYIDDQDVYLEKLNPDNDGQYLTPTGYKDFETRHSIIQVKDAPPVTLTLQWSDNGPVLPGTHYNLGTITPPGHVASVAWTVLSDKDTSLQASLDMIRSASVRNALKAAEDFVAPGMNLTLADSTQIALKIIGSMPVRDPNHQTQGQLPSPGWKVENRWQGMFPYRDAPVFLNPEGGILGNTNNKPITRDFPRHISQHWGDTQRIQRWTRLMASRRVHTRESFIEAQLDTVSPAARTLLPIVAADLWRPADTQTPGTIEDRRQSALGLLAQWNGEMNEHLPEPLIYAAWMRALQRLLVQDELGSLTGEFTRMDP